MDPVEPRTSGWMYLGFEPVSWAELGRSRVTLTWLAIVVAMFALTAVTGDTLEAEHLSRFGATDRRLIWQGEIWRLLTAGLLHFGFGHFFWNAVALPGWGSRVERELGSTRTAIAIVSCMIASSSISVIADDFVGAGASGGLLGMMGITLVLEYRLSGGWTAFLQRRGVGRRLFAISCLVIAGFWVRNIGGFEIDNWAHVGGLAFGLVLGATMTSNRGAQGWLPAGALAVLVMFASTQQLSAHGRWTARYDEAIAHSDYPVLVELLEDPPAAIGREWAGVQVGWAQVAQGKPELAIAAIDAVLPRGPRSKGVGIRLVKRRVVADWEIDARRFRALAFHNLSREDEALAEIDVAIADAPKAPWPRYVRALIYNSTDKHPAALEDLEVALAHEQEADFYEARYTAHLALRNWDGALADVFGAEKLALPPTDCASKRGWVDYWRDEDAAALMHFDAALKLDATNVDALCGRCQALSATKADSYEIVAACSQAIEAAPDYVGSYSARARAHVVRDEFALAALDADSALKLKPKDLQSHVWRTRISLLHQDLADAKRRADEMVMLFPDDATAVATAGEVALSEGDIRGAKNHYLRALELAPSGWSYIARAKEILELPDPKPASRR